MNIISSQFSEFVVNHLVLWVSLGGLVLALIYVEAQSKIISARGVAPKSLVLQLNDESAIVVDLRDPEQFIDGHILGSINVPISEFTENFLNSTKRLIENKNKQIVLADATVAGAKVDLLIKKLKEQDFQKIEVLNGGIAAWKQANLPLTKK
jgi:rhodanese-related sulfurtransferase